MPDFSHDKSMAATNVAAFLERNYRETGPYQWVREAAIQNPLEAGATQVYLTTEWQAVEKHGVYRRVIADDGSGIPSNGWDGRGPHPMERFFNEYGGTGKSIGGAHENFGIGCKCTLLPWNKYGLVVISVESLSAQECTGTMIWLRYNEDTGEYGLRSFETDEGFETVIEAGWDEELQIDWMEAVPDFVKEAGHGLVLVLLGDDPTQHTILGDPSREAQDRTIGHPEMQYIASRYWDLPLTVRVDEFHSKEPRLWPQSITDIRTGAHLDNTYSRRRVRSMKYQVVDYVPTGKKSGLQASSHMTLTDGTVVHWYLWPDGVRPDRSTRDYISSGVIAARYRNEILDVQHPNSYRSWGISEPGVRKRLWLIAQPRESDASGRHGVYMSSDRCRLLRQGGPTAGGSLPWLDWAEEFRTNMPTEIIDALKKERAKRPATSLEISDEDRQRLAMRFASRWKKAGFFARLGGKQKITPTHAGSGGVRRGARKKRSSTTGPNTGTSLGGLQTMLNLAYGLDPSGQTEAVNTKLDASLPQYQWVRDANHDKDGYPFQPMCIADWIPPNTEFPSGMVKLNWDHPVYEEEVEYWTKDLAIDTEIADAKDIIDKVYGTTAVAVCAHVEALAPLMPRRDMADSDFRSPQALTAALLGLVNANARIAPMIGGKLKRRQKGTP